MAERKIKVSVALMPSLVKRLDAVARVQEQSRSSLITDLIQQGLADEELVAQAVSDPVIFPAVTKALTEPGVMRALLDAMRSEVTDDQLRLFQQIATAQATSLTTTKSKRGRGGKNSKQDRRG